MVTENISCLEMGGRGGGIVNGHDKTFSGDGYVTIWIVVIVLWVYTYVKAYQIVYVNMYSSLYVNSNSFLK